MKIVHLCLSNFFIDNYSYQENMLPKYHVLQGHTVTMVASLVSFDDAGKPCLLDGPSESFTTDGFKVRRIDYKKPFYKLNKYIRIYNNTYEILKEEKPDIIFIHDFTFMDIRKIIKYLSENKNVQVYVDCHTDYINSAQTWISRNLFYHVIWRFYAKKLSPFVTKFYGVTPLRCDFLREAFKINKNKVELLELGVDDHELKSKEKSIIQKIYREKHQLNSEDFIIVSGGKIDSKKNIHLLVEAIKKMNLPDVKLILFGTYAPEIKEMIDDLKDSENIIYVGWLNADSIMDYLILADLVIFPGTHSVLWEQAVGVGTPCIVKYWEGMTHIDVGGNCVFLHDDSVSEITKVLTDVVCNSEKYDQMKKVAIQEGLKRFSYSEISKKAIDYQ